MVKEQTDVVATPVSKVCTVEPGAAGMYAAELLEIRGLMRDAFEHEQWQDLADLDRRCRSFITEIVQTRDQSVMLMLSDTLLFYRELLTEFGSEKSSIAGDVMLLRRAQSSNRVYRIMNTIN